MTELFDDWNREQLEDEIRKLYKFKHEISKIDFRYLAAGDIKNEYVSGYNESIDKIYNQIHRIFNDYKKYRVITRKEVILDNEIRQIIENMINEKLEEIL